MSAAKPGIAHTTLRYYHPGRYSLFYASRGANVVVNDFNKDAAQKVVDEITSGTSRYTLLCANADFTAPLSAGGKAVVNNSSVTDGAAVIKTALDAFGGVTILINNAGILRDKGYAMVPPRFVHRCQRASRIVSRT